MLAPLQNIRSCASHSCHAVSTIGQSALSTDLGYDSCPTQKLHLYLFFFAEFTSDVMSLQKLLKLCILDGKLSVPALHCHVRSEVTST